MRIIDRLTSTAAVARLRAQVDRLRRSVMTRRPVGPLGPGLGRVISAWQQRATGVRRRLRPWRTLSRLGAAVFLGRSDQGLPCPRQATDPYRIDDQRRVEVAADRFEQAAELGRKLDLGQHPVDEIRSESAHGASWNRRASVSTERHSREKMIERLIGELEGVKLVGGIDQPPPRISDVTTELEAVGVRLHRDGGGPVIALSDRANDPRDPDRIRA